MKIRLRQTLEEIKASYWFVPSLMAIIAIILSFLTIAMDASYQVEVLRNLGFIWSGGAEGARGLLETVAGSMITVAGVAFSITMVALSLASSQFGSRLLRNFMADTGNQVVLGTFVATFIYCLLVLRTIRAGEDNEFVPYISVTIGLVLALTSLAVLIYFIHHAALSMQAPYVIGEVAADLFHTIERLFPSEIGIAAPADRRQRNEQDVPGDFNENIAQIVSNHNGYIQAVDDDALLAAARDNNLIMKLAYRPGHFIFEGIVLAHVWPEERMSEELEIRIKNSFIIGKQRTHTQDVEFAIEQLVEVAERSLSSGINDPFTAIACIDWLSAALAKLADKNFPSPFRYDHEGNLRIFFERPVTLVGAIDTAFNQIRQSATNNVAVRIRLLEQIAVLHGLIDDPEALEALERHAQIIERDHTGDRPAREDREDLRERYQDVGNNDQNVP